MKKRLFFPKLALQNMLRNRKFEFPFLLTGIFTAAMFYNMVFLSQSKDILKMPGSDALAFILMLGCVVVGLFSVIFLLYTNSFLVKRRQKEFGLYNILGMEKRHIAHMMLWETLYTCFVTIVGGILIGILLSKLMLLFIFRMLFFTVHFGFEISFPAILFTVILFSAIYFAALLWNTLRVSLAKPVELLHASNAGEKEPKTKWIMAIVGLLSLGGGYYIALTTDSPLDAIGLFFFAVILVIIGTYCLFTAGSIAVLKLLKKNKKYYYNKKHFSSVSGMLYRMKQNAVGLSNICILSTMVLVMISASVCLYLGADGAMKERFPRLISFYQRADEGDAFGVAPDEVRDGVRAIAAKHDRTITNLIDYRYLTFSAYFDGATVKPSNTGNGHIGYIEMITADGYATCNHRDAPVLADDEVIVCMNNGNRTEFDMLTLMGRDYHIKDFTEDVVTDGAVSVYLEDTWFVIVKDDATLLDFCNYQSELLSGEAGRMGWQIAFDVDGDDEDVIACYNDMVNQIAQPKEVIVNEYGDEPFTVTSYRLDSKCRPAARQNFYAMYGGLLFLGIFLGALFMMATALIIYYKQISEGYDDRERFIIMQQVGMSRTEVKKTISSQILSIFFLPLIVAVIHLAGSFRIITKMFLALNLTDVPLFALCALGTAVVFGIAYFVIYSLTARTYYRLVH